jgi:SAM-dependent methyltransferase
MTDGTSDAGALAHTKELLDRFLTGRNDRTLQAYTIDLDDFARFLGTPRAEAAVRLLAAGPASAWQLVVEYGMHLRRHDRAPATVERRFHTLRALVREAHGQGLVSWHLQLPTADEVSAAMASRPVKDAEHYLFPRHLGEVDRLDIQHYVLRATLQANHLAPVEEPACILDIGSGTGQWAYETCQRFDSALVVGLDLVSGKPGQPPGYRYVRGNLLQGLPFADEQFDFVHQRLLAAGLPVSTWPAVVAELVRVTRPGGWVELVEMPLRAQRPGPAVERLTELGRPLLEALSLDTTDVVYRSVDGYLRDAGLTNVVRREATVPVGRWGGEIGSLMVTTVRAGATRVCEVLQARGMLSDEEARVLLEELVEECENGRIEHAVAVAFGQKPPR